MKINHRPKRGRKPWELDCGLVIREGEKKRVMLYFATKQEATEAMRTRAVARRDFGASGEGLSAREVAEVVSLRGRLAHVGGSLALAVEFYLRHAKTVREVVSVGEWVQRALREKEGSGARESYLGALRVVWGGFARGREGVKLGDVSRVDLETWLESGGWARRTQASKLGDLRLLFAMAEKAELIAVNPCAGVEVKVLADEAEISCMTPAQARELMRVVSVTGPDFIAYAALGIFAGLRTGEIEQLSREDIQFDEGVVVVSSAMVKTRARRVVKLPVNAVQWLRFWAEKMPGQVRVLPFSWERRWAALREFAGWRLPWPKNVMRHTAASMHFAAHGDEAAVKTMLGHHASEDTLHRHYRAVKMLDGRIITGKIAGEFWGILPGR